MEAFLLFDYDWAAALCRAAVASAMMDAGSCNNRAFLVVTCAFLKETVDWKRQLCGWQLFHQ